MRLAFAALCFSAASSVYPQNPPLERIQLPPGFRIEVLASVPNARSLALGAKGTLFVGSRSGSAVHAVARSGKVVKVADGLSMPNGVAFRRKEPRPRNIPLHPQEDPPWPGWN